MIGHGRSVIVVDAPAEFIIPRMLIERTRMMFRSRNGKRLGKVDKIASQRKPLTRTNTRGVEVGSFTRIMDNVPYQHKWMASVIQPSDR